MAIGKTIDQIDRLHKTHKAISGQVYDSEDGKQYLGLASGRLKFIGSINNQVSYDNGISTVVNIGKYNNEQIEAQLDQVETNRLDILTHPYSGVSFIPTNRILTIIEYSQMINYGGLRISGVLDIDGDLILK